MRLTYEYIYMCVCEGEYEYNIEYLLLNFSVHVPKLVHYSHLLVPRDHGSAH